MFGDPFLFPLLYFQLPPHCVLVDGKSFRERSLAGRQPLSCSPAGKSESLDWTHPVVLNWEQFLSPGDIWQYLGTFLVVTVWGGGRC